MIGRKNKSTINILMFIDSYFGESQGRLWPVLKFLLCSAAPFILYVFFLTSFVPLMVIIVFELFWTARMAMIILGHEKERVEKYKQAMNDEYASADDLVRIEDIKDDGLIEYMGGTIAYIVKGFTMTYTNDDRYSIDMEAFLNQLKGYEYDIYCHAVVDEFKLQDNLENMRVYTDKELMQERMLFYIDQDSYCSEHTELYRIVIVVKTLKYNWKVLKAKLDALVSSEYAGVFKEISICNKDEVNDIIARDICANVDINTMLINKYKNESYYNSKVLFYGDDTPEEYLPEKEDTDLSKRRVVLKKKGVSNE